LHREIGSYVASLGVTLLTVGTLAKDIADAAQSSGVRDVTAFETHAEAGAWLVEHLQPGDVVLVKGSRSEHMETVIEQLQENLS
jgi:UDP-N-acetylmuramoyl-tripeptide--D-alanyl-D-alanine ligase